MNNLDNQKIAKDFLQATDEFNRMAMVAGLGEVTQYYWYHTIDLPHGLVTPGQYDYRSSIVNFNFPQDMSGNTVLDVGAATGFFSFELEKRGARVVAVEIPSLDALDCFPGQSRDSIVEKIGELIAPKSYCHLPGYIKNYTKEELYFYLLKAPFAFCHDLLHSKVERCFSNIYDLCPSVLGVQAFDYILLGDILVHTLNPLQALAVIAPLCRGTLVISQSMPDVPGLGPAMQYVGGQEQLVDTLTWWLPNQDFFIQLLKKLGFHNVRMVGSHLGHQRPTGIYYDRPILHAIK